MSTGVKTEADEIRAQLGRAFGMWYGGLDGPPPSVEELVEHAKKCVKFDRVLTLNRLEKAVEAFELGQGLLAVDRAAAVVVAAKQLVKS